MKTYYLIKPLRKSFSLTLFRSLFLINWYLLTDKVFLMSDLGFQCLRSREIQELKNMKLPTPLKNKLHESESNSTQLRWQKCRNVHSYSPVQISHGLITLLPLSYNKAKKFLLYFVPNCKAFQINGGGKVVRLWWMRTGWGVQISY